MNTESTDTTLYNDGINEFGKTGLYTNREDAMANNNAPRNKIINIGETLLLKSRKMEVISIISEGTGEANIYLAKDESGYDCVLKIYNKLSNEEEEPNGAALERIKSISESDILELFDYGIGPDKFMGIHCFEILEYAKGGNLLQVADFKKKYSSKFIELHVLPQLFRAIEKLHTLKIYHCDLKPSNVFYKDVLQLDIVVGDYGSAKAYGYDSRKVINKTVFTKGTDVYLAPELSRGIVSGKADYYSLGMVILHLMYPEEIACDNDFMSVDKRKFEVLIERQYNQKPLINYKPENNRINNLIQGLTQLNHLERWGLKEVKLWLENKDVIIIESSINASTKTFKLGKNNITTSEDLIQFINTYSNWFTDLFEDNDVKLQLNIWLDNYIGIDKCKQFDELIENYRVYGKNITKEAICMFFAAHKTIQVNDINFNFLDTDNLFEDVKTYIGEIDNIYQQHEQEQIRVFLLKIEFILKIIYNNSQGNRVAENILYQMANSIGEKNSDFVKNTYNTFLLQHFPLDKITNFYNNLILFLYCCNNDRGYFTGSKHIKSGEELAWYYLRNPEVFDTKFDIPEREAFLIMLKKPNCISLSRLELCKELLIEIAYVDIEIDNLFLDKWQIINYSLHWKVLDSSFTPQLIHSLKTEGGLVYKAEKDVFYSNQIKDFIKFVKEKHSEINISASSIKKVIQGINKTQTKKRVKNVIFLTVIIVFVIAFIIWLTDIFGIIHVNI